MMLYYPVQDKTATRPVVDERRIEVFVKIQKKKKLGGGRGVGGSVGGVGLGGGVRVDVNEEFKFL